MIGHVIMEIEPDEMRAALAYYFNKDVFDVYGGRERHKAVITSVATSKTSNRDRGEGMSESKEITEALNSIARASTPARELAKEAVERYRRRTTMTDPDYDFNAAPVELRQVVYDVTVRFSRRRLWSRLLR